MTISKIKIKRVIEDKGLVGFASCVLDDCLYLGNIAIFSRLNRPNEYRIVFPVKDCLDKTRIEIFYPLTKEFYFTMEGAITKEFAGNN